MSNYHCPDSSVIQALKDIAHKFRINSILMTTASNSGHPTSCCSMAEIMSVLYLHTMKYKVDKPRDPTNDRFVLSKGHAAPILYAACAEVGMFPAEKLMDLRKISSDLEGHPTPRLNFIDVATGSLGQGLSCAAGMAYVGKYIDKADYRVYCLIGDGESAEGSVWEALHFASLYKLDNLVLIIDINRLGQSEATSLGHDIQTYHKRIDAFGWHAIEVDGHDVEALCKVFDTATTIKEKPTCILAKTFKGKHCPGIEDQENWHGKALGDKGSAVITHIKSLIANNGPHSLKPQQPTARVPTANIHNIVLSEPPNYKKGDQLATRAAYGNALVKIGTNNNRVIALDGDMKNSTFSNKFRAKFPDRFIECYIAEQNMVGVAIGCATRDRTVAFVSTFASFFSRAYDQLRMGAISMTNVNFVGSHAGISIGEDGPSQMALEDLAMFRALPGSTVFYPSDAVSTEYAVQLAANTPGVCLIRVSRPNTPVIYDNTERFAVGKLKVVRESSSDKVTVVGACVTLVEVQKAADRLAQSGVNVRVLDLFTVKPIDRDALIKHARETGGKILTVEDHYPEGGIGEAVAGAVSECRDVIVKRLAVTGLPRSGKPAELLEMFGIGENAIVKAVNNMLSM